MWRRLWSRCGGGSGRVGGDRCIGGCGCVSGCGCGCACGSDWRYGGGVKRVSVKALFLNLAFRFVD